MTAQTVRLLADAEQLINANDRRKNWKRRHQALVRYWRQTTHQTVRAALRASTLTSIDKAHITITFTWPDRHRRDVNNLQPTAKPIVDGLVDAGLLPDDDDTHVTGPDLRRGYYPTPPRRPVIEITVTIEELP